VKLFIASQRLLLKLADFVEVLQLQSFIRPTLLAVHRKVAR